MPRWRWLFALILLPACGSGKASPASGSSPDAPGSSDAGSGTKTLYAGIELDLAALAGGATPNAELTVVLARGMQGGAGVSGADVTLAAPDGVTVTAAEDGTTPGSYRASGFTWEPSWHVQISAGSDELELTLAAPGATTVTTPTQGASVAAGPVTLEWTDAWGAKAESVWAECCGAPTVKLTDSGTGSLPVTAPGGEVTLYRQNALVPSGGAQGSLATAETSYGVYLQAH
ncbi:MAG TPA: hypothetical protein VMI54_30755 [Polyangiaceae bacterium]|nr:hypothetical protein [Polyangiaceae bacterium]